jgi:leucyl-tRNA synthetase
MDSYCRWLRHQGHEVFQPLGYDAFGLPAELAAQKEGRDPAEVTQENITNFRAQMRRAHTKFDERLVTSDPSYQKWTQWIFTQMLERGLAYKAERPEPYCPSCKTVLAKAQVTLDKCERCKTPVEQRATPQWFLRITDYKQRLIDGLNKIDYPESTKAQQRHWLDSLTDWCVSRQRKWGCPIPVEGETDTLDTFVDSSFYYVRYCDPTNEEQLCAPEKYQQVDLCVGGAEHACAHLIYARFVHMFLYDIGAVPVEEPFKKVLHQGMITKDGHKMSKSTGNVVDPDNYSTRALRMYLMFIGPYTEGGDWNDRGVVGVTRFLNRFEEWMSKGGGDRIDKEIDAFEAQLNKDTAAFKFNKVVSGFMTFLNQHKGKSLVPSQRARLNRLLNIYAPTS